MKLFIFILISFPLFSLAQETSLSSNSLNLSQFERKVLESNPDVSAFKSTVSSKEKLITASYSGYLPELSLNSGLGGEVNLNNKNQGYVGYLNGSLNLYRGGKDSTKVKIAEVEHQLSQANLEAKSREVLFEAREAFFVAIYLKELWAIEKKELETNSEQKKMAVKKVNAGLTSSVDNFEFELREDQINSFLRNITGEQNRTGNKIKTLVNQEFSLDMLEGTIPDPIDFKHKYDEVLVKKNMDFQRAVLRLESSQLEKKSNQADFLPEINFKASQGRLTPSHQSFGQQFDEQSYGLILTVPLFSGLSTFNKNKSLSFSVIEKEKSTVQASLNFEKEFKDIQAEYSELFDLYKINEKKLERAPQYYSLTLSEYKRGIKNSPDVVGATERLYGTMKRKLELSKDLAILDAKIKKIIGEM